MIKLYNLLSIHILTRINNVLVKSNMFKYLETLLKWAKLGDAAEQVLEVDVG